MRFITKIFWMLLFIPVCSSFLSCTIWNTSQWKNLQNKNFTLTRFVVYNKGGKTTGAYQLMRSFPVKKTMKIISDKYNINVNISNFTRFVNEGKADDLEVFGVLTSDRFTWEKTGKNNKVIEVEYNMQGKETFDGMIPKYTISIKTNGKLRAIHSNAVEGVHEIPLSLIKSLFGSSEKYAAISTNESCIIDDTPEMPSARIDTEKMGIFFDSKEDLEKARHLLENNFQFKTDQ